MAMKPACTYVHMNVGDVIVTALSAEGFLKIVGVDMIKKNDD